MALFMKINGFCLRLSADTARLLIPLILLFLMSGYHFIHAQKAHTYRKDADQFFNLGKYNQAEELYRKSLEKEATAKAEYNLGNAVYMQKRYDEAAEHYQKAIEATDDPDLKADAYYNLGNAHFQKQAFDKSVEAYKNALKIRPDDLSYKHNLQLAQKMLKRQQQQQQQQQQKDKQKQEKNKDQQQQQQQQQQDQQKSDEKQKEQQQQQKEQNQKDQKDQKEKQEEKNKEQEDKKDQKDQKDQREEENGKQSDEPGGEEGKEPERKNLSKEDALRLLKVIEQEDKKVNQKLRKATGKKNKSKKDW